MTLLVAVAGLARRRELALGALHPLADSLAADLDPLLDREPYIPAAKALLSRIGGRCETDGTDLEFDPASPHAHRCPACGRVHAGEVHDRWWLYPYQLWLAERVVHAAVLGALRGDERHTAFARAALLGYADQYLAYPNRDNVLGPSRLFFSTYLESLWLLHICIGADMLSAAGDAATAGIVRDRIVQPAVALIEEYDEGLSNRQVWNDAAIVAARTFLGEGATAPSVERAFAGIETMLTHAVGADGCWYEGDNYHQFAHRGLWYGVTLGERAGYAFDAELLGRFEAGFGAPFMSALPDFTYPARKDSRYAASLRQWRFAESCELGLARCDDPVLVWALARMYADDAATGDTGRARSSGEAERHATPVRLTRADLGWKSLLFARETLPPGMPGPPGSVTIESQGLTIHRREQGTVYVALDWGEGGGGHGHPDRLNLLFSHVAARRLDDLGTGSYVDPSLHWYRSTLAHNAPLVGARSQPRLNGECTGIGSDAGFEFVSARVDGLAGGVRVERTVVTAARYFIDEVRWAAEGAVPFDLPVHFDAECDDMIFVPRALEGGGGLEDGFDFVRSSEAADCADGGSVHLHTARGAGAAQAFLWVDQPCSVFRASAPGQPASDRRRFHLVRCHGARGVIRSVWSWSADPLAVEFGAEEVTVRMDGTSDTHRITDAEWLIRPGAQEGMIEFTREVESDDDLFEDPRSPAEIAAASGALTDPHQVRTHPHTDSWFSDMGPAERDDWAQFELGEAHYRRSEESWHDAGSPRAGVAVGVDDEGIAVHVAVETDAPLFVPAGAPNPLDNEHADINGHGIQLYLATEDDSGAWILVPEAGSARVRVRPLDGWGEIPEPAAEWRSVPGGFELRVTVPAAVGESGLFALDVLVNDAAPGRVRRRGQLVMSGAEGEFVYLRGDRHDAARLIPFSSD